ncbi:hypothetical protein MKX54_18275 [Alkalihalobacillus sp. FSL R5-0424]
MEYIKQVSLGDGDEVKRLKWENENECKALAEGYGALEQKVVH